MLTSAGRLPVEGKPFPQEVADAIECLYPFPYRNSTSSWLYDQSGDRAEFFYYAGNKEFSLPKK